MHLSDNNNTKLKNIKYWSKSRTKRCFSNSKLVSFLQSKYFIIFLCTSKIH